ncbi:Integrase [Oenococcus oeni]|uniref:site-specific integrase n=1 Tax=Oenococcus oeni TaxID=1247 RepID=UPI00107CA451|nr:site-specific integrase [Oenococcus oeni]AVI94070.1 integrase [Oenococcus oeni]SYV99741.1 Integrase [Oenococcus oeni]SYW03931.1 Integrase [Oenococcus oeni]SYW17694.1 Integrase [Oenococcus oeni]VDC14580.1 Integrase [Oenococcus oeni]
MATIAYQSKTKTYRVQIITPDHKRVGKSGFHTKTAAKTWLTENQLKIVTGKSEVNSSHELLSDYFKHWYETYKTNVTDITLDQYKTTYRIIEKYLPHVRLNDFTREKYQKFLNKYGEDHAKETVAKRKTHISACLKDAFADKLISEDITQRLTLTGKAGKSSELKFLEYEDFKNLEQYSYDHLNNDSQLAIFIAIHTGMRIGEIRALKIKNVDFVHSKITIDKAMDGYGNIKAPKTVASNRVIKIDKRLLDVLKGYKRVSGLLVQVTREAINHVLTKDLKHIGAKNVTFHALRHSHASYLLSKGVSIQYVSERLGHSSVAITENVYSHLLQTLRENEENKVTDLMNFQ